MGKIGTKWHSEYLKNFDIISPLMQKSVYNFVYKCRVPMAGPYMNKISYKIQIKGDIKYRQLDLQ